MLTWFPRRRRFNQQKEKKKDMYLIKKNQLLFSTLNLNIGKTISNKIYYKINIKKNNEILCAGKKEKQSSRTASVVRRAQGPQPVFAAGVVHGRLVGRSGVVGRSGGGQRTRSEQVDDSHRRRDQAYRVTGRKSKKNFGKHVY